MDAPAEELAEIAGIGPMIGAGVHEYFLREPNRALIEKLAQGRRTRRGRAARRAAARVRSRSMV